jgi:hypothetical protein
MFLSPAYRSEIGCSINFVGLRSRRKFHENRSFGEL